MTALNQTLTGPGSTAVHVSNSETCLFALIAVTATSISAQLECGVGAVGGHELGAVPGAGGKHGYG